ncbi:MAG: shikimate kinase [Bacteroidota bacterium]|nr:shikimate kinase [Bacteroidota bacterium]
MHIYLIGLTGSGKTTLGKQIAQMLKLSFIDLDEYVCRKENKTVSQIFADHGETYFRNKETEAIKELSKEKNLLIATGGGAACFNDNMTIMNVSGITVFLYVPVQEITDRLWSSPQRDKRPMIEGKNKEQLLAYMTELYEQRLPFYNQAKLIIKGNSISANDIVLSLNEMD